MDRLKVMVELLSMLRRMEHEFGLERLSSVERDIFLAAYSCTREPGDIVQSEQIRKHRLVRSVSQATYHRGLRNLLENGLLENARGSKSRLYVVRTDLTRR